MLSRRLQAIGTALLSLVFIIDPGSVLKAAAAAHATTTVQHPLRSAAQAATPTGLHTAVPIVKWNFGVNIGSWDAQMPSASTPPLISQMGFGYTQYPNLWNFDWKTNTLYHWTQGRLGVNTQPYTMTDWASMLSQTKTRGLFIFNIGPSTAWNPNSEAQQALQLINYVVSHHIRIRAIVVGSEEYTNWGTPGHLLKTPQNYAAVAKAVAIAIHGVDPSMKVGVDIVSGTGSSLYTTEKLWNQVVLREDGPYVQFVSVHTYINPNARSDSGLLSSLSIIPPIVAEAQAEIARNVQGSQPQIWITEFNPSQQEPPQTIRRIYGVALTESMILWLASGASQVDWWSLHGDAHQWLANGTVASQADETPGTPYGLFSLAGEGLGPQLPLNQLYPSGVAYENLLQAVGSGGVLTTTYSGSTLVASIVSGLTTTWFGINNTSVPQTVGINGQQVVIAPTSLVEMHSANSVTTSSAAMKTASNPVNPKASNVSLVAETPTITSYTMSMTPSGMLVTVAGKGFGSNRGQGYVYLSDNGINWGAPQDDYKVNVQSWTDNQVKYFLPTQGQPNAGSGVVPGSAANMLIAAGSGEVSAECSVTIPAVPVPGISGVSIDAQTGVVTVNGTNFGSVQGAGYITLTQNGVNWGAPSDWYKVRIDSWSSAQITFTLPGFSGGIANTTPLAGGNAGLRVTNGSGATATGYSLTIPTT